MGGERVGAQALCLVLIFSLALSVSAASVLSVSGPSKQFSSLSRTGTRILNCDDCNFNLTLPFTITFGSRQLSSVSILANGAINLLLSDAFTGRAPIALGTGVKTNWPRILIVQSDLAPNVNVRNCKILVQS